jgi:hypothetical protein
MLAMHKSTLPHHDGRHVPASSSPLVTLSTIPKPRHQPQLSHMKQVRPRLSLNTTINTTQPRTFGKGSSLSLDTLSAVSPTAINTFSNAYQSRPASAPSTETRPKLCIDPSVGDHADFSSSDQSSSRTPSSSSVSSASTAASEVSKGFYEAPKNLASILVNSPHRKTGIAMLIGPPSTPSCKRVSFRDPLDEQIITQKYTLAHSDIESAAEDDNTKSEPSSDTSDMTPIATSISHSLDRVAEQTPIKLQIPRLLVVPAAPVHSSPHPSPRPKRHGRGAARGSPRLKLAPNTSPTTSTCAKRDSSSDEDSDDAYTQTPVAGRCKRRRDWTWTLGPLPGYKVEDGQAHNKPGGSVGSPDDDTPSTTSSRCTEASPSQGE